MIRFALSLALAAPSGVAGLPPGLQADAAIARCNAAAVRSEGPFAPPPPPKLRPASDTLLGYDDDLTVDRRTRVDPLGVTLVGIGTFGITVGVGLLFNARKIRLEATSQPSEPGYYESRKQSGRRALAGASVLSLGVTTAVGGIIRWVVVEKRRRRSERIGLGPGSVRVSF